MTLLDNSCAKKYESLKIMWLSRKGMMKMVEGMKVKMSREEMVVILLKRLSRRMTMTPISNCRC